MNPRLFRLIAGFLAGFVVLSYAPVLPTLVGNIRMPSPAALPDGTGLAAAAVLTLTLLLLVVRRRRPAVRPVRSAARPPSPPPASALLGELRRAADQGERVPALARRFRLSQDAVRAAVGAGPSSPAARAERVSRARQRALPAPQPAVQPRPRASLSKAYRATG